MTAPLNGHAIPTPDPDPAGDVARGLYESQADEGDTPYDDLPEADRAALVQYCQIAIGLHAQWLTERGFRIVPPGATALPQSEAEAMGMVAAAKAFLDGQKRKGKLLGGVTGGGVILPKGRAH